MALKELNTYQRAGWMWSLRFTVPWLLGSLGLFPLTSPQRHCHRLRRVL